MCIIRFSSLVIISSCLFGAGEKPDFSGSWRLESGNSDSAAVLKIAQKGDVIRISNARKTDQTDVTCNTMGRECNAIVDGEAVDVSYYYNGPTLVETLFFGAHSDRVTKTRRTLSEDSKKMLVEIFPIVPAGRPPRNFVFVRAQQVAATTEQIAPQ